MTNGSKSTFGIDALKVLTNGVYVMYGGDADGNGVINAIDKNLKWLLQNGLIGNYAGDFNLDGVVNAFDINLVWLRNNSQIQQLD